jgi:hypothetical protein
MRWFFLDQESDLLFFKLRWRHQLAYRVEDHLELRVVFFLQRIQPSGQLRVRCKNLAEPDEGAHNFDIDLDSPPTLEHVEPRALVQAVKRNRDRFPADFMFQLTDGVVVHLELRVHCRHQETFLAPLGMTT